MDGERQGLLSCGFGVDGRHRALGAGEHDVAPGERDGHRGFAWGLGSHDAFRVHFEGGRRTIERKRAALRHVGRASLERARLAARR